MIEVFYEWMKRRGLRRIEILGPEDTAKKVPIESSSRMARAHQKFLDAVKKKKNHDTP